MSQLVMPATDRRGARARLLGRLDRAWTDFRESYAGLPEASLMEPGVTGDWSVKDVLAHVMTWEAEALKHLPVVLAGGRPPRYARYGGIDAFNAEQTRENRRLSLPEVLRQLDATHARLVELIRRTPEAHVAHHTRFRRRLRLDTYGHYPEHAAAIRAWRRVKGPRPATLNRRSGRRRRATSAR